MGAPPSCLDDGEKVVDVGFDVQSGFEVVGNFGLAEPAKIRAHDLVEPAEIRHPAIPEPPRAAVTVLQEQIRRLAPGVGVVIERIVQRRFSGATELRACTTPSRGSRDQRDTAAFRSIRHRLVRMRECAASRISSARSSVSGVTAKFEVANAARETVRGNVLGRSPSEARPAGWRRSRFSSDPRSRSEKTNIRRSDASRDSRPRDQAAAVPRAMVGR